MSKVWLQAFRLHTLPLSLAGIITGIAAAATDYHIDWLVAALCIATAIFLQILSNLANDYGDAVNGADNDLRSGPTRAVASGLLTKQSMKKAIILFVLLSLVSGIGLLVAALPIIGTGGVIALFILGLVAIAAAITYTAGKMPYGYKGLGDISVFLFFGLLGVMGTAYINTGVIDASVLLPAAGFGMLSAGVLNVNNLRDLEADEAAGKKTVALRLGLQAGKIYHAVLLFGAMLLYGVFYYLKTGLPLFAIIACLPGLLLIFINIRGVGRSHTPQEIAPYLKQLVKATLLHTIFFCTLLLTAAWLKEIFSAITGRQ